MIYLKRPIGIVHLLRLLVLIVLIILIELVYSSCSSNTLNDYLGYSHPTIFFFYILIWISFSFDIYFLLNRLLGHPRYLARRSTSIVYLFLLIASLLCSSFTLVAWIRSSPGYLITQDDRHRLQTRDLAVTKECNDLRWIPIILGYTISLLNSLTVLFLFCYED